MKRYQTKDLAIKAAYEFIGKSDDTNNLRIDEGSHKGGLYDCIVVVHDLDMDGKVLFGGYWG